MVTCPAMNPAEDRLILSRPVLLRRDTLVQCFPRVNPKSLLDVEIRHDAKNLRRMITMARSQEKTAPRNDADQQKYQ
jgi:hypothetical protein